MVHRAYRYLFYLLLLLQSAALLFLFDAMKQAPYSANDVANSFQLGCNFGGPRPLNPYHMAFCEKTSAEIANTLNSMDGNLLPNRLVIKVPAPPPPTPVWQ